MAKLHTLRVFVCLLITDQGKSTIMSMIVAMTDRYQNAEFGLAKTCGQFYSLRPASKLQY